MSKVRQAFHKRQQDIQVPKSTLTIESKIFKLVKEHQYEDAIVTILEATPKIERVKYITAKFKTSEFKAYSLGMKRFCERIDKFILTGDKQVLLVFDKELKEEALSVGHNLSNSTFNAIRNSIIEDAVIESPGTMAIALSMINGYDISDKKWMQLICELCQINWPNHQGFKVLFG